MKKYTIQKSKFSYVFLVHDAKEDTMGSIQQTKSKFALLNPFIYLHFKYTVKRCYDVTIPRHSKLKWTIFSEANIPYKEAYLN